jgi:hypothetical protein
VFIFILRRFFFLGAGLPFGFPLGFPLGLPLGLPFAGAGFFF